MLWLDVLAIVLALGGVAFIVSGLRAHIRQGDLTDRLLPFHGSIADEAEEWLQNR